MHPVLPRDLPRLMDIHIPRLMDIHMKILCRIVKVKNFPLTTNPEWKPTACGRTVPVTRSLPTVGSTECAIIYNTPTREQQGLLLNGSLDQTMRPVEEVHVTPTLKVVFLAQER